MKGMNEAFSADRAESRGPAPPARGHQSCAPGSTATEHLHQVRTPRVYKRDGHLRTAKYDREHPHVGDHDHRRHGEDAEQEARRPGGQGGQRALQKLPDIHHPRPGVGAPPHISGDRTASGSADGEGHRVSTESIRSLKPG